MNSTDVVNAAHSISFATIRRDSNKYVILFRKLMGSDLVTLRLYVEEMSDLIQIKKEKIKKVSRKTTRTVKKDSIGLPPSLRMDVANYYERYDKLFIGLLNNTAFISTFSIFEGCMGRICWYLHTRCKIKLEPNELKGSDIDKYYIFLEKIVGLDMSKMKHDFMEIRKYRNVRNYLVHHQTKGTHNQKEISNILKSSGYLQIRKSKWQKADLIIINNKYTIDFIALIEQFIKMTIMELLNQKGWV